MCHRHAPGEATYPWRDLAFLNKFTGVFSSVGVPFPIFGVGPTKSPQAGLRTNPVICTATFAKTPVILNLVCTRLFRELKAFCFISGKPRDQNEASWDVTSYQMAVHLTSHLHYSQYVTCTIANLKNIFNLRFFSKIIFMTYYIPSLGF